VLRAGWIPFPLLLLALCVAGCGSARPLPQEMYVWQLAWTPAVRSALERTSPAMARVHVLALEIDPVGESREPALDVEALRQLVQPPVPVVRIDGRARDLVLAQPGIRALLQRWRNLQLPVQAIEIDFDCATGQLDAYARFLSELRAQLPPATQLVITALPAWMASPHLPELARRADEVVLQVHSVSDPVQGLFDAGRAREWIERYARITSTPFKVALPAYGSKVQWNERGHVVAVVSETRASPGIGLQSELAVDPQVLAAFVQRLARHPVPHLSGIVWFRMPTDADQRAWSVPTFLAVVRAQPLRHEVTARFEPHGDGGDIVIANTGTLDAPAPRSVRLDAECDAADAVSGYTLQRRAGSLRWERSSAGSMRAGATVHIGWANCGHGVAPLEINY
jgi:hypothetical protein